MKQSTTLFLSTALVAILTMSLSSLTYARGGHGGYHGGGGHNVRHSSNHNVNVNRHVNKNVNVNVDRHGGYYHGGGYGCCYHDHYHPIATAAAVTTAAVVTSAVIGSIVYSVPPNCSTVVVNGFSYRQCGDVWYQPQLSGSSTTYVVVNNPG